MQPGAEELPRALGRRRGAPREAPVPRDHELGEVVEGAVRIRREATDLVRGVSNALV